MVNFKASDFIKRQALMRSIKFGRVAFCNLYKIKDLSGVTPIKKSGRKSHISDRRKSVQLI